MIEFECKNCGITVYQFVADAPPEDELCLECRVILEAAPEDQEALARIFRKPWNQSQPSKI